MPKKSPLVKLLGGIGALIPNDSLRTVFYLNVIKRPRQFVRALIESFYRFDHVYDVIREAKRTYRGRFTILEFGTSDGYAFTKILFATRYLAMDDRVIVHGFDSFEGMPAPQSRADDDVVTGDGWVEGEFAASLDDLNSYCSERYDNFELHPGYFEQTITPEFLELLRQQPPILVWIDCDYYSSAKTVFERILPFLPSGCVIYFDDVDFNYRSRLTGEMRLIHEVNSGLYETQIELVLDPWLANRSQRVYRLIRLEGGPRYEPVATTHEASYVHKRTNDSPLP